MTNPTTDLAARFEAKREKCDWADQLADSIMRVPGLTPELPDAVATELRRIEATGYTRGYEACHKEVAAEPRDMARAGAAGGAGERVRSVLAEWFSGAEGMCRAYEGDLPDKAEIYVGAAKRSRLYLGTYGELRRAALSHPGEADRVGLVDLAERFEVKREEALKGAQDRSHLDCVYFQFEARANAFAEATDMARAGAAGGADWTCAARRQGAAGGNDPADCDWPVCGCDPYADKVVAALQESGHLAPPPSAQPYGGPGIRDPLVEITRKPGKEPCGECRIQPGETCDICGARQPPAPAQQGSSSPPLTAERVDLGRDPSPEAVEMMAEHLHEEEGQDRVWRWPEHADDDGYRGNGGHVTITPTDVQCRLREMARRVLIRADQIARRSAHLVPASLPAGTGSADEGTDLGAPAVVQTGWHCTATDGKPRYNGEWGERYLLTWSERTATADINCIDGEWSHGQEIALTGMDWWCWIDAPPYSDAEGDSAAAEGQAPGVFVEGYLNDLCLAGKHPAQQQTSTSPTSPQEGEVKSPQIDPVGEAKALLEGLPKDRTPEQHIAYRRWQASEPKFEQVAELCLHRAEQIEAALATLRSSQAGEVRS